MTLQDLIDKFVNLKNEKDELNEQIKKINEQLATIEGDIMSLMSTEGVTSVSNDRATCTMKESTHPAITDWPSFYAYVQEQGAFELLHKRLSAPAFRERWDSGVEIPGTTTTKVWELSVRRK